MDVTGLRWTSSEGEAREDSGEAEGAVNS